MKHTTQIWNGQKTHRYTHKLILWTLTLEEAAKQWEEENTSKPPKGKDKGNPTHVFRKGRAAFSVEALDFAPVDKASGDGPVATLVDGRTHVLVDGEAVTAPDMSYVAMSISI